MAEVLLSTLADALGGPVPVDAVLTFTATRSRASGAVVVANGTVTVRIVDGVPTEDVDLVPSGVDWAYKATLSVPSIGRRIDRTIAVPDVPSVEWADLVDVDPATLLPDAGAVPAWTAAVGQVAAILADTVVARDAATAAQGLSEDARDAAVIARGIAEGARDGAVLAKGASEAARDQAEVFAANTVELQDTTFTALIADPDSATRTQLNATFVSTATYSLAALIPKGTPIPNDGILDAAPAIMSAISTLRGLAAADSGDTVYMLDLGPGRFRLESRINMVGDSEHVERVGIRGAGRSNTVLLPVGAVSAIGGPSGVEGVTDETPLDFFFFRNLIFEDFTVDCRGQVEGPSFLKAFIGGGWYECTWSRVNAIGSTGSTFGTDYPVRSQFIDCHVVGSGRGYSVTPGYPSQYAEARSGFGIGFGHYDDESVDFIGCSATSCLTSGFFFERQDHRETYRRESVIRLIGCDASGNGNGITDAGCGGVVATNCKLTDNIGAGYYTGVNGPAKAGGIYGRVSGCSILRNGYGVYITGSTYSILSPDLVHLAGGGYVFEHNRIAGNENDGILGRQFRLESGGLTVRANQLVRNGGAGLALRNMMGVARDIVIDGNQFDGNAMGGCTLMLAMNAPRITDNDFINSDGVNTQTDGLIFHVAEPVAVPRIQRNTFRRIDTPMVNGTRLDQTSIGDNLIVTSGDDPDDPTLYNELLQSKPNVSASTLGAGWVAGAFANQPTWLRTVGGARPSSGSWGAIAIQYRDLGQNNVYVESIIPASSQGVDGTRFRGVAIAVSGNEAVVAGVDNVSTQFGPSEFYSLWKVIDNVPTLLWQSTFDALGEHEVALARETDSTVTTMFIDGVAAHTVDIPDVPLSNFAGVGAASGIAGTSGSTPSSRVVTSFRALHYAP